MLTNKEIEDGMYSTNGVSILKKQFDIACEALSSIQSLECTGSFSEMLKISRDSMGLSVRDVAQELHCSPTTVSGLETGKVRNPRASTLIAFCRFYGLNLNGVLELIEIDQNKAKGNRR